MMKYDYSSYGELCSFLNGDSRCFGVLASFGIVFYAMACDKGPLLKIITTYTLCIP
jgi:hypothetical protein